MVIFEISDNCVKALWGRAILKDVQIGGVATRPLKSDSQEEVAKAVSSIIGEETFKISKPIVLCIPRNQTTLRNLEFPAKDKKELDNILSLHVTREVPYPREEIIYNYEILGKTPSGFTTVLLCIIHRQVLIKQFSVFERLNLYPDNVLLSTFGLMNFLGRAKPAKDTDSQLKACVDVGDKFTDFFIFKGKQILLSKSMSIGGSQMKEEDKLSHFIGSLKQAMAVSPAMRRENISRFYISGVKDEKSELEKIISDRLQIPAETIDPFRVIGSLKEAKDIDDVLNRVSISAVLGVAMDPMSARFNFVLPEAKLRRDVRDMAKNLFVTGGVIIYLIVLGLLGFAGNLYGKQAYLNKLMTEIKAIEYVNRDSMEALEKIKAFKKFTGYEDSFLHYYYELSKMVPKNITVERLIFNRKKEFSIIGKGTDMGEIFKFVRNLNSAKMFGKVELRYSRKAVKAGREFNEFNIMCHTGAASK